MQDSALGQISFSPKRFTFAKTLGGHALFLGDAGAAYGIAIALGSRGGSAKVR
jgi:hypothetical protein